MAELSGLLLVVVILALLFDFSNGWHDSANAIATVVSTRVVSPSTAVLVAGVLNVAGAFMSTAVAKMVGTGIVDPQSVTQAVVASVPFFSNRHQSACGIMPTSVSANSTRTGAGPFIASPSAAWRLSPALGRAP